MYRRPAFQTILSRVSEPRRFIQILAGPRQTGKTTLAQQVIAAAGLKALYGSADEPSLRDRAWIETTWDTARTNTRGGGGKDRALLVLDEVQKVTAWSETVKRLWDEDTASGAPLQVVLLGSSPLLPGRGLSESLTGRFELIPVTHWSYPEMREAFQWDLERYLFFGGYPGAAPLVGDEERWRRYIIDSLIETTISRDILLMSRVDKPALLRRLFHLACDYSGQILSYQKMLGQLHDAGNTTTLAHYLDLLGGAGMVTGLQKFSGAKVRQRGSSPKLQVLNTALLTAQSGRSFEDAGADLSLRGRLIESAVGAHLLNSLTGSGATVSYWRERSREVDFVVQSGTRLLAIEVKSGRRKDNLPGMEAFAKAFKPDRRLLVGEGGVSLEEFLQKPASFWLEG
jgi:predicted AAA+ superfamily ATPase